MTFRELHESGCFVLPNPWDVGSAKILEAIGFKALATSSAGLAFTLGCVDSPTSIGLDSTLENVRAIAASTSLPVNADFQAGYGDSLEEIASSVRACIDAGAAGLSIEDARGRGDNPLYERKEAVARFRAAREAVDRSGADVVLTGRAECFLVGIDNPLPESITRLEMYAEAGADCLYAPGLRTEEEVRAVVAAVAPKPVNVLLTDPSWMTLESLGELGVRRISVGSALARTAWTGFLAAAREIHQTGRFDKLSEATPFATMNAFFCPS